MRHLIISPAEQRNCLAKLEHKQNHIQANQKFLIIKYSRIQQVRLRLGKLDKLSAKKTQNASV